MKAEAVLMMILIFLPISMPAHGGYPQGWGPLKAGSSCNAISGVYANRSDNREPAAAELISRGYSYPVLSTFLLRTPSERNNAVSADSVEIAILGNVLRIRVFEGLNQLGEAEYSETAKNFRCEDGWAIFWPYLGLARGAGNPVIGYEKDQIALHAANDGSLILRSSTGMAGLLFFAIPTFGTNTVWMRFRSIK